MRYACWPKVQHSELDVVVSYAAGEQADAARSVFEAAVSATALPLSLEVVVETWVKSLTSVFLAYSGRPQSLAAPPSGAY